MVGCCGFGLGIAFASWFTGVWVFLGAIVAIVGFGLAIRSLSHRDRLILIIAAMISIALGVLRYSLAGPGANSVVQVVGRSAIVEGRVIGADLTDRGVAYTVDALRIDDASRSDRIRLEAPISSRAVIGDRVRASCVLEQPQAFDGFAYDRFLAAKSTYAICRSSSAPFVISPPFRWGVGGSLSDHFYLFIGSLHAWIDDRTRSILPEPQATLLLGLLIGENDFSDRWSTAFQITGTSHIVAASGYNVSVLAEIMMIAFVSIGLYRRQAYPLVIASIVLFVIVAGAGAAVIRAGVMGVLAITARHLGRHASPRNIIAVTIGAMLLVEPRLLRDDVGFQLSAAATVGLILLTDRIAPFLKRVPTSFGLRESLASTLAATIATLPITLLSFGQLSVIAPLVNLLVLPLIPYAMGLGVIAIVVGLIVPMIGVWIALPAWTALVTMTGIIDAASRLPFASTAIPPSIAIVVTMLGLAVTVTMIRKLNKAFERNLDAWHAKQMGAIVVIGLVLFAINIVFIAWRSGRFDHDRVHVFVFDVGQGNGMYIQGDEGNTIIDGGPTRYGLLEQLSGVRFPWERSIDEVFVTHPHADHVVGLIALIDTNSIGRVVVNGIPYSEAGEEGLEAAIDRSGVPVVVASATMSPRIIGDDARLQILWPLDATSDLDAKNPHRRSVVAKLTVGEHSMLFTGDAEADVEQELLAPSASPLAPLSHVDVLKVGHHGSDTSSSQQFLEEIDPDVAIVSVGEGNSYGHPSLFSTGRIQAIGSTVFRTDLSGTIRVDFGDSLSVKAMRFR